MKIQIRKGVFETNSSSTHSITIVNKSDFDAWKTGEYIYDSYCECLIPINEKEGEGDYRYYTYDEFFGWGKQDLETYMSEFTTTNGDIVVGFGCYGYE